jgi:hypothetical protein
MRVFAEILEVALGHNLEFFLLQLAFSLRTLVFVGLNGIAASDHV